MTKARIAIAIEILAAIIITVACCVGGAYINYKESQLGISTVGMFQ